MTRRRGLIAAGIASVVLLLAMAPADQRMRDSGGPGIVPFELAGNQDRADEILAEWGDDGQDAARQSLWIDFGFLVAYGIFLTLALAAVRDLARERGRRRLAALGGIVVSFGALGAAFDALEDVCLLLTLDGEGSALPLAGDDLRRLQVHLLRGGNCLPAGRPGDAVAQSRVSEVLRDVLGPGLRVVFCGTAPGTASAQARADHAGPGNGF